MDAYSVSTSSAQRSTSRIYQDLKAIRQYTIAELASNEGIGAFTLMETHRIRTADRKPHVGVIGGGLAGLRCADILLQHGFHVTIVEARQRLGGRVHQERLPNGHLVDMGPNWIHGTEENPIHTLALQTGTPLSSWDSRSYVYDERGKLFSVKDGERYSTIMWTIVEDALKYSNNHSNEIDPRESLYDFFRKKIPEVIPDTAEDAERDRNIVMQLAELWGAFVGSPIQRQSLKFFWLEECIEGENLFCAGTYEKILELVAKPAVAGATIRYGTVASTIMRKTEENQPVRVVTAGGENLEFDEVVLTAPLGWLKKNLSAFDPPLPSRLCKAIGSISYGSLEKVYISFPKAFWMVPDEEGRIINGFCQWLAPNYALDSNPERWTQETVELGSLAPSAAHPTLLFYIYGDESRFLTDAVLKLDSKEKKEAYLYDFFRPYYSRLPHYSAESADCQPTGCVATDWLHDDLAGNGSYSNFQVGLEVGDEDIQTMREGLPQQGLWLAGEHTAPYVALGTATGAYWSGESVGRRIAEAYGRRSSGGVQLE